MNALPVSQYLAARGVAHALIGAHALAFRGSVRFTLDVDFLTTEVSVLRAGFWTELPSGASVDARKGDFDDPLAGVVHIRLADDTDVDVVVGKYRWQKELVERAEVVQIGGVAVPVPRTADLILLKLFAGGHQDVSDVRALLELPGRDALVAEVDGRVGVLPEDASGLWEMIKAE